MSRVVIKEQSLKDLADIIREKTGTTEQYDVDELVDITRTIGTPDLEELYTEVNGEFIPTKYGYSKVVVNTPVYRNFEEVEF